MFLNSYLMKRLLVFGLGLSLSFAALSQDIYLKDGVYYEGNKPYSGPYSNYYESGRIKMRCYFSNGYPDKSVIYYFENGNVSQSGFYDDGDQDGLWSLFNQNGEKVGEAHYVDGKKDGIWTLWDENGNQRYHMMYRHGQKVGNWQLWDDQASLVSEKNF